MDDFKYEPPIEDFLRKLIGPERYDKARQELIAEKKNECANGNHAWKRIAYDLQGGKWGTERCIRCGAKETWHV